MQKILVVVILCGGFVVRFEKHEKCKTDACRAFTRNEGCRRKITQQHLNFRCLVCKIDPFKQLPGRSSQTVIRASLKVEYQWMAIGIFHKSLLTILHHRATGETLPL